MDGGIKKVKNFKNGQEWTLGGDEQDKEAYMFSGAFSNKHGWWDLNATTKIEPPWFGH